MEPSWFEQWCGWSWPFEENLINPAPKENENHWSRANRVAWWLFKPVNKTGRTFGMWHGGEINLLRGV